MFLLNHRLSGARKRCIMHVTYIMPAQYYLKNNWNNRWKIPWFNKNFDVIAVIEILLKL